MSNLLAKRYPRLSTRMPVLPLATLPTPVSNHELMVGGRTVSVSLKHDDQSAAPYGGNKVRKLEYLLPHARDRGAVRIATFGAAGSNHALATAIYSRQIGLSCTCLLSHQPVKPAIARTLLMHQQLGTEIVRFGGSRAQRVEIQRTHLQGRRIGLLPMGGSAWRGCLGFVNAAFELQQQIDDGDLPVPTRVYVAMGTMGTVAGLGLGFALVGLNTEIHAVRVTDRRFANPTALDRLLRKTAALMHRADPAIPADLASRARIVFRDDYYGDGYGRSNPATDTAIRVAEQEMKAKLESTYSGKAMTALLADATMGQAHNVLFWNTYNSRPLDIDPHLKPDFDVLPQEFARYFSGGS